MSGLYLDANAIVSLFVAESMSSRVVEIIGASPERLTISDFGAGEFASAISRLVRTSNLSVSEAELRFEEFDRWKTDQVTLFLTRDVLANAGELVRRFELRLRLPDAIHLALCAANRMTLVTGDKILRRAAGLKGVVVVES